MEAWREELYHAGIFDVIKSKYKSILTNAKSKIGNTADNSKISSKQSNPNREWKNHKYIRKENGRYIYPEDLKKKAGSRDLRAERRANDRYSYKKVNSNQVVNRKIGDRPGGNDISEKKTDHKSGGGVSVRNGVRLNNAKLSEPKTKFEDENNNDNVLEKVDDFLYSTNAKYKILSDGIKVAGSVLSKLYNKGKSFVKWNVDWIKSSSNNGDYSRRPDAISIMELEGIPANTSNTSSNEVPKEIAEALYEVMSGYYEDRKKNGG